MLHALGNFLLYGGCALVLLFIFGAIYLKITPYDEKREIQAGHSAPAIALGGALLGFTFPILAMMHYGANLLDFMLWAAISGVVQIVVFKILYWGIPMQMEADNKAAGILYGSMALCVGLITAFALIPS